MNNKNEAICMQPFDSRVRKEAYISVPYPFILGNNVAGTVAAVGAEVKDFKVGDRVVSDTPTYLTLEAKWGGWQKFVLSRAAITTKVCCILGRIPSDKRYRQDPR